MTVIKSISRHFCGAQVGPQRCEAQTRRIEIIAARDKVQPIGVRWLPWQAYQATSGVVPQISARAFPLLLSLSAQDQPPRRAYRGSPPSPHQQSLTLGCLLVCSGGIPFIFPILSHRQSQHDLKGMCIPISMYITPFAIPSFQQHTGGRSRLLSLLPTHNGYRRKVQESPRLPLSKARTLPLEVDSLARQLCY